MDALLNEALEPWASKRVLVTGGRGFVGTAVVQALLKRGVPAANIRTASSADLDLRVPEHCRSAVKNCDVVFHLAARTGGIAFARAHAASQYRDCSLINLHMIEAARTAGVKRFVALANLLAYPGSVTTPLTEDALCDGPVAASHFGIGQSKRDLALLVEMYHREHGMNAICVLGANAYGPNDRFDTDYGHVIPATIMKCFRDKELVVWGDGAPTRDFLYVDDLAEGIVLAAERLPAGKRVNIASGIEVSIGELVRAIAGACEFRGKIVFDASKGGGDQRRVASTAMARKCLGFAPKVALRAGLQRTVDWYRQRIAVPTS